MFSDDKNNTKCPDFLETMFFNNDLYPNFMPGFSVTGHTNLNKFFGANQMTTILTNKLIMSSIHPSGYRFGISYNSTDKTQNLAARYFTMKTSLDADLDGHVSGNVNCNVLKNITFGAWGQRDSKRSALRSVLKCSNDRFNVRAELSTDTQKPWITLCMDNVCRVGERWSIGSRLVTTKNVDVVGKATIRFHVGDYWWSSTKSRRGDAWWSNIKPHSFDYSGALKYDGDRDTFMAMVNKEMNASLHFQRRVNDRLTVGAEVTADFKRKESKVTWIHRATLGSGIEIRGQLDTNGMVIGHFHKRLSSTILGTSCAVAISALLNHRTNALGLGVELIVGTTPSE